MFKHKLILFPICFAIVILSIYEQKTYALLFILLIVFSLAFKHSKVVLVISLSAAFLFALYLSIQLKFSETPSETTWKGYFTDEIKINGNSMRGFIKNETNQFIYFVYDIQSEKEKLLLQSIPLVGKQIVVIGEWEELEKPNHRYAFNMERYLKSKNAHGPFRIERLSIIGEKRSLSTFLAKQRWNVAHRIDANLPSFLAQEAKALLIGVREGLDDDVERAYQKLGITHLFAISGLHVGIITLLIYELLLRLHVRKEMATFALLICLPLYALLAGGAPSVWRAVIMVECVGIVRLFNKNIAIDDALSISCTIFLLLNPHSLFQVGFQLSYIATYSLIYSSNILNQCTNSLIKSFLMTTVCQILSYPLLLVHFYEISLSSLLANLVFVPLFSFLIVPLNIAFLLMSFFSTSFLKFVLHFYEPFRMYLNDFVLLLNQNQYQMWTPGKPSIIEVFFLYCSVLCALYLLEKRKFWLAITILLIPALFLHIKPIFNPNMHISFINVGQGDSILIELPHRKKVYLIDAGGVLRFQTEAWKERATPYEVGRQVIVPYLKGKGISKIDKFILTHADADHVEGADEVMKEMRIGEIHITPNTFTHSTMKDIRAIAQKRKIPIIEKMSGEQWEEQSVYFAYLSPNETNYEGNNDSLVLYVQYKEFTMLLTGDLEEAGEKEILKQYPKLLQDLTVLKAGHHGSKTSSSEPFLQHTNPKLTIFSAGKNNRFNHPAKEVVERFHQLNFKYFITGLDGTIELIVHKNSEVLVQK